MPKRKDIKSILIIGAGPIVIGQACEFDYSGTQAARALKEEGYKIILVNSNPATIMTDPGIADRTYIEPITLKYVLEIIKIERPDAILPTVGGQTALNMAIELNDKGILIIGIDHYLENKESLNWDKEYNLYTNTLSKDEWLNIFKNEHFSNIKLEVFNKKDDWGGTLIIFAQKL